MFYKIKKIIFISSLFFIFSCATSQQGTEQMVSFSSIPNGATVKTSHGFSCSITPCKIKLPRNKSFKATISKPGFTTEVVKVDSLPSGAGAVGAVGSALIGGVLVTGYDVYKGGVFELSPNEVSVKLQSTTAMVLEEIRTISNMDLFKN
jgi:hypothetical protein